MNPLYLVALVVSGFLWVITAYNIAVFVAGVKSLYYGGGKRRLKFRGDERLPRMSIIVPVKNEERVVGRLLKAIMDCDYPSGRREVIIVEDGSVDRTCEICRRYVKRYPGQVKLLNRGVSDGKPGALVEAFRHVDGDIVGVFDADNIPDRDFLLRAARHFEDGSVAAVQGSLRGVNEDENILTKFVSREEALVCDTYIRGKDALGLFVPFLGSCYFVRKKVLDELDCWDAEFLSEDLELATRLTDKGYKIKYGSDVRSLQEHPAKVSAFIRQRTRWFRGAMEVSLRYGSLLKKPSVNAIDAELTMAGPFVLLSCLLGYIFTFCSFSGYLSSGVALEFFSWSAPILSFVLLGLAGFALILVEKSKKAGNVFWIPFIYVYWFIQIFVALRAFAQLLFRRPKRWERTVKTGKITTMYAHTVESQSSDCLVCD